MISRVFILAGLLCFCVCVVALVVMTPDRLTRVKAGMTTDQVEAIMGRPATIEQSESTDQAVNGEVDHYPSRFPLSAGDCRITFVNHIVFKTEFVPGIKS
jgi:hypothetical protein